MLDQNLHRWVFASCTAHFAARTQGILTYVEGQLKEERPEDYYEIRMNGPHVTEVSHSTYLINVGVSIFCSSSMNDTNFHRIHEMAGIIAVAYTDISVHRYGPASLINDGSLIGCLVVNGMVKANHFGQLAPYRELMRATVDGFYKGLITIGG